MLLSEPVEWPAEYRCFVADGRVVATSPYLSFGHALAHHPGAAGQIPTPVLGLCADLAENCDLPRALVIDVGLIEDRGWAVVEFNPAWCSGILSAEPDRVLDVPTRACESVPHR